METVRWRESYSVGNQLMDNQHKKLIKMINTMHKSDEANVNSEIISDLLSKMTEYADLHFKAEESYMEQMAYPQLEVHKEEHIKFKKKVGQLCLKTMAGEFSVPEEILQFLSGWLINHILHSDMKYKIFSESKNDGSRI